MTAQLELEPQRHMFGAQVFALAHVGDPAAQAARWILLRSSTYDWVALRLARCPLHDALQRMQRRGISTTVAAAILVLSRRCSTSSCSCDPHQFLQALAEDPTLWDPADAASPFDEDNVERELLAFVSLYSFHFAIFSSAIFLMYASLTYLF